MHVSDQVIDSIFTRVIWLGGIPIVCARASLAAWIGFSSKLGSKFAAYVATKSGCFGVGKTNSGNVGSPYVGVGVGVGLRVGVGVKVGVGRLV